jgi:hypothetical protein
MAGQGRKHRLGLGGQDDLVFRLRSGCLEADVDKNQLIYPHGELTGSQVMIDTLDDNLRRLKRYLRGISEDCLHWQVDEEANPIALILWHMGRLLDVFFTQLALGKSSAETRWFCSGWAYETGYDPRGLGREGWGTLNDYTREEVAGVPSFSRAQLLGYLEDVYASLREYLKTTPVKALAEAGEGFEGKYTRYQIISMALMDNVRHLGEILLIKSLWERSN